MKNLVAMAEKDVSASPERVWEALTDPQQIKRYMFGSDVETDWKPGSPITWSGEYEGKGYQDKGEILEIDPNRRMRLTHFSPLSGQDDVPENYHTLTYELEPRNGLTHVSLSQDGNGSEEEVEHATSNWEQVLDGLKRLVEAR